MPYRPPPPEQDRPSSSRFGKRSEEEEEERPAFSPVRMRRPFREEEGPVSGGGPVSFKRPREMESEGYTPPRPTFYSPDVSDVGIFEELIPILIPEAELKDPEFRYSSMFENLPYYGQLPQQIPQRFQRGGYERGREEAPRGPRETPRAAAPERRERSGPPRLDPNNWLRTQEIFQFVRQHRNDPGGGPGKPMAVQKISGPRPDEMSQAQDLIRFFKIPKQEVERYQGSAIWDQLLHPFLDELSYALNQMKPNDLPGEFGFQQAKDRSFWLGYLE